MPLSFNGTDLFGFDLIQQQQLRKLVGYLEDAQAGGSTQFPYIPATLFFGFDCLQVRTLTEALAWAWSNPSTALTIKQNILTGGFESEQVETLTKLTRACTDASLGTPAAPTTAYSRIRFTETWGAPVVNVAEVNFYNFGSTRMTGTAIYSTQAGTSTPATAAFDQAANTYWSPSIGDASQSIGLLLSTPSVIKSVSLQYRADEGGSFEEGPRSFVVENSNNGSAWTTVLTVTNIAIWTAGLIRTYNIP